MYCGQSKPEGNLTCCESDRFDGSIIGMLISSKGKNLLHLPILHAIRWNMRVCVCV